MACSKGFVCDTTYFPICKPGCKSNSDCPLTTPICNTATKQCRAPNCGDPGNQNKCVSGQFCDTSFNPPICRVGCATNSNCPSYTPICDSLTKQCRIKNCIDAGVACNPGYVCNINVNPPQCILAGCNSNSDCPISKPICNIITKQCKVSSCLDIGY